MDEETPHVIEVDDYVRARMDEAHDHFGRMLDRAVEKIRDDMHEALSLVLMLTAASWGALAEDADKSRVVAAVVTLALVAVAGGYLIWSRLRRRRRAKERGEADA